MDELTLEFTQKVLHAAINKASQLNRRVNIAIVDAGGNLKGFMRMDGAWLGSIDISLRKAKTARLFDMDSGAIGKLSQPGGPLYGIELSNGGLITFAGGLPLMDAKGEVIGAVGVSGGMVDEDQVVATAAASAVA